ncbi:flavin reductase family protein [Mycobacterium sp. 134]|uniref:flavin reductase family protein n=1 Tax=Mycobacterium sp. 134 TaxID=3400425 RepID=UPI003AADB145
MTNRQPVFSPGSPLYRPDRHHLRGSMGRFATGVAVVTFDAAENRHGVTVNSFAAVSLEPPLVLVSIQHSTRAYPMMRDRPFVINVLGAEQEQVAWHFAGKPSMTPTWIEGPYAPRLCGALSYFECVPWAEFEAGDHSLFLGQVQDFDCRSGDALGFLDGQFIAIPELVRGHESLI